MSKRRTMSTPNLLLVTILVLGLLVPSCVGCSPGAPGDRPAAPSATNTPLPADLSIAVPRGDAAGIDGTLRSSEWANAREVTLNPEGELLLMHDGQYLYLGLRGKPDSVGSVCFTRGSQVLVLHSSLGVGTAIYELSEGSWQRTQDFGWTWFDSEAHKASDQKAEFRLTNGWIASTMGSGSPGEMEYQIAVADGEFRLAVVYFTGDGSSEESAWWPAQLADSCRQAALIQGRAAVTQRFQPGQWVSISALSGN